jgi:MEMO1 family protein
MAQKLIRNPAVAGQFYPGSETGLREQLTDCFRDQRGCGTIPNITNRPPHIRGLVVPHAGYVFSGPIASHAYCALATHGFADTFIILGPNHTGNGSGVSVMTQGSWRTPLGIIPINEEIASSLQHGIIDADETAHRYEHSIEVQLPFLQFLAAGRSFDFVPICMMMQDWETSEEVGRILADAISKQKRKVAIIASSDFSHVGFNYMNIPPEGERVDEYARKQDRLAIDKITTMDPHGLVETIEHNHITMCGYGPVASMLVASKQLGATKAELLKYGTSYEVHPDTSCVGYGALAVYSGALQ